MAVPCATGMIGYIILTAVHVEAHKGIGYLATFFCTIGVCISYKTIGARTLLLN